MSTTSDLERRIAELDNRLRQARLENENLKTKVSPSRSVGRRSTASAESPAAVPPPPVAAPKERAHISPKRAGSPITHSAPAPLPPGGASAAVLLRNTNSPMVKKPIGATSIPPPSDTAAVAAPPPTSSKTATAEHIVTSHSRPTISPKRRSSPMSPAVPPPRNAGAAPTTHNVHRDVVASPWRDVTARTLQSKEDELSATMLRQRSTERDMEHRVVQLNQRLVDTNRAVVETDRQAVDQQRRKDIALAETHRDLEIAERRTMTSEQASADVKRSIDDLTTQKATLVRQIEETRLAIARSEGRSNELMKEQMALEARIRESTAALREREAANEQEAEQFALVSRRLQTRITELEDENAAATDALRTREAHHAAQERQWREEEEALQSEVDQATQLLAEMKTRLSVLQAELADREAEAEAQAKYREQRNEELIATRMADRQKDQEEAKREWEAREQQILRERESILSTLRQQTDTVVDQIERKKRSKQAQEDVVNELKEQLVALKAQAAQREALATKASELDEVLAARQSEHDAKREKLRLLITEHQKKEDEVADLEKTARRLANRLDEESRLKGLVAELAREVSEATDTYESERATADTRLRRMEEERSAKHSELLAANAKVDRVKESGAAEIDTLSRRIASLRQEAGDKESLLNNLVSENAAKQAAIAEFEEEKRRLEREQLARKAAAAQAAKVALSELN